MHEWLSAQVMVIVWLIEGRRWPFAGGTIALCAGGTATGIPETAPMRTEIAVRCRALHYPNEMVILRHWHI
jgi:hypothetical protein